MHVVLLFSSLTDDLTSARAVGTRGRKIWTKKEGEEK